MANFGNETDGASSTTILDADGDNKWVSSASPASSGTVVSMTHRLHVTAGSVNVRGIIYSDNAGAPGTLLAVTDDGNVTGTAEAAVTLNFSGANIISITSGTTYWIGLHWQSPSGGDMVLSRSATANLRRTSDGSDTFTGGTATDFAGPSTLSGPVDTYVTYTTTSIKNVNGLAVASVKSKNGLAIASIKNFNGLA